MIAHTANANLVRLAADARAEDRFLLEAEPTQRPAGRRRRYWHLLTRVLRKSPAPFLAGLFRCYSEVLFVNGSWLFGAVVFACTVLNWRVGLSGILAVSAAYLSARAIRLDREFFQSGFYVYNPLLVGLSLGAILEPSWPAALFVAIAAVLTLLLTVGMAHLFHHHLHLPVLTLPFTLCCMVAHMASLRYSNILVHASATSRLAAFDFDFPLVLAGFFRSLGAVFLLPYNVVGILLALLLLSRSRILFFLAVLGYYTGTLVRAALLGSILQAFGDVSAFNFVLIAMALGGVFLTPSLGSFLIAAAAVAGSTLFLDSLQVVASPYGIPVYALPFNVVSLGVIYVLRLTAYPRMATYIGLTPEQTFEFHSVNRLRYPGHLRSLSLPFFGRWSVWQAFNGDWTHKGPWRFAYDFVITDDEGKTFDGDGSDLSQYYCWRKPVVSPISGRVVAVRNDLPEPAHLPSCRPAKLHDTKVAWPVSRLGHRPPQPLVLTQPRCPRRQRADSTHVTQR